MARILADLDGPGLIALGPRNEQRQHAVPVFSLQAFRVDLHREGNRAVEGARRPFPTMNARILAEADGFPARDPDGLVLHLNLDVRLAGPRQLCYGHEVIALLEDVDRGETAGARGRIAQPITIETPF